MSHTCHARACNVEVPPSMFMCRRHWYMIPFGLRKRIWAVYVPGQEDSKDPSIDYLKVAREAILFVAEKERAK